MSMDALLEEDFNSLDKYERLVRQLEKLIDSNKIESIAVVVAKKDEILKGFPKSFDPSNFQDIASDDREKLTALLARVEELTEREKQCMAKALNKKEEIAGKLRDLKNGKKIVSGYHAAKTNSKSRFKDLKT